MVYPVLHFEVLAKDSPAMQPFTAMPLAGVSGHQPMIGQWYFPDSSKHQRSNNERNNSIPDFIGRIFTLRPRAHLRVSQLQTTHGRRIEGLAVQKAMSDVVFKVGGSNLSYGRFYRGFGLSCTISTLFSAIVCWQLGAPATVHPRVIAGVA
jgi:hypothetical protein